MQEEQQKERLPAITHKPHSLSNVFNIIKMKKAQLTKNIQDIIISNNNILQNFLDHQEEFIEKKITLASRGQDQNYHQPLGYQGRNNHTHHQTPKASKPFRRNQFENHYQPQEKFIKNPNLNHIFDRKNHQKQHLHSLNHKQNTPKHKNIRNKTELQELQELNERKNTNGSEVTHTSHSGISLNKNLQKLKVQEDNQLFFAQAKLKFMEAIERVPKSMKQRHEQNLSESLSFLQKFNPFFNRTQKVVSVCLMKMSRIIFKDPHMLLYKQNEQLHHFYLILLGKVKITDNNGMRRSCQNGESILEEIYFSENIKKVSFEKAKTLTKTYLLEIKVDEFKKIKEQLIRFGYKAGFLQMQSILKRNFIIKNWMRNKQRLESNK